MTSCRFRPCPASALALGIALLFSGGQAAADTLYKCTDDSGVVLYTNQKGNAKNCTVLSREQAVSTISAPKPVAKSPTPADFPRVDAGTQKNRDSERRKILEQELGAEQQQLEQARRALTEGEAVRLGNERNYQKYLDRIQQLKDTVALHERNVEAIKREIGNLK